jgi:hypothetical protein
MKNIHVLPTDKPSRLYKHNELGFKLLAPVEHEIGAYNGSNQNIYITNDEEIKEGDWVLGGLGGIDIKKYGRYFAEDWKKIILTTNQDLINDGVQAIDDEFLEWFVKNPSCEFVEVVNDEFYSKKAFIEGKNAITYEYKIIIPKEEPKCLYDTPKSCENSQCRVLNKCNGDRVRPKQETLEEANWKVLGTKNDTFYNGAKWQAERMYSEEEVFEIVAEILHTPALRDGSWEDIGEWFEQFKKK